MELLDGRLQKRRIFLGFIEELAWCNIKIVTDLKKFCHRWQRFARGYVINIASAMPEIITHLIFGDAFFQSQLGNSVTHELCVHIILTTYSMHIVGDGWEKMTHDFTLSGLKQYRVLCYNTGKYVCKKSNRAIHQVLVVLSAQNYFFSKTKSECHRHSHG